MLTRAPAPSQLMPPTPIRPVTLEQDTDGRRLHLTRWLPLTPDVQPGARLTFPDLPGRWWVVAVYRTTGVLEPGVGVSQAALQQRHRGRPLSGRHWAKGRAGVPRGPRRPLAGQHRVDSPTGPVSTTG